MRAIYTILSLLSLSTLISVNAVEFSFGPIGGSIGSEQKNINTLIGRANTRAGGISTADLNSAWEFGGFLQWKFDYFGIQLRPTYFTQSEDGSAPAGSSYPGNYEYSVKGTNIATIFKLYPMENANMRLYFLGGVTWGMTTMKVVEGDFNVEASGSSLGYQCGAGIDFIFDSHILFGEVSWRYLNVERNMVDSTSGTPAANSVSQYGSGSELEFDNRDISANMSGSLIMAGYGFRF